MEYQQYENLNTLGLFRSDDQQVGKIWCEGVEGHSWLHVVRIVELAIMDPKYVLKTIPRSGVVPYTLQMKKSLFH